FGTGFESRSQKQTYYSFGVRHLLYAGEPVHRNGSLITYYLLLNSKQGARRSHYHCFTTHN
ncbi:MAG: hypothetical protein QNJ51_10005, partial [Calothrix sp. MO_167.B12]|nr:hypothetical protein [Calothrix sp. MO_167.B12]